jgi:hypothetical protein
MQIQLMRTKLALKQKTMPDVFGFTQAGKSSIPLLTELIRQSVPAYCRNKEISAQLDLAMQEAGVAVQLYVEAKESLGRMIQRLEAKGILVAAGHKR